MMISPEEGAASSEQTIEVHGISEAMLQRLDERAQESGRDRSQIIRAILAKELGGEGIELTTRSFDAALAPIRQGFVESGLSEAEATALLEDGLRAVRRSDRVGNVEPQSSQGQTRENEARTKLNDR